MKTIISTTYSLPYTRIHTCIYIYKHILCVDVPSQCVFFLGNHSCLILAQYALKAIFSGRTAAEKPVPAPKFHWGTLLEDLLTFLF